MARSLHRRRGGAKLVEQREPLITSKQVGGGLHDRLGAASELESAIDKFGSRVPPLKVTVVDDLAPYDPAVREKLTVKVQRNPGDLLPVSMRQLRSSEGHGR